MFLGSILAGVHGSHCHGNTDVVMAVAMVTAGGSTLAIPWCRQGFHLILAGAGRGLAQGMMLVGTYLIKKLVFLVLFLKTLSASKLPVYSRPRGRV